MSHEAPFRGPGQRAVEAREQARTEVVAPKASKARKAKTQPVGEGAREPSGSKAEPSASQAKRGLHHAKPCTPQGKPSSKVPRKRSSTDNLCADAAALRREFESERRWERDDAGAESRDLEGGSLRIWLKNCIGFFLLPVAWVWTLTVFGALQRETVTNRFWATEDFRWFGAGVVCWMLWFTGGIALWGTPKPMRYYVLGHEATHAVWAWLSLGNVSDFRYGPEGGHIVTNKPNFWVTLSPYFYPIYCVVLFLAFGVASFFYDFRSPVPATWWVTPMQAVWFAFGVAWAFHLSFTLWMIRGGQSDLSMHGNFFSVVVIYIMNLVVFTVFLWLAAPGVGVGSLLKDLTHHAEYVRDMLWNFGIWFWGLFRHPQGA